MSNLNTYFAFPLPCIKRALMKNTNHKTDADDSKQDFISKSDESMKDSVYADIEYSEKQVANYLRELDLLQGTKSTVYFTGPLSLTRAHRHNYIQR